MEITALLEFLKGAPETIASTVVLVVLISSLWLKKSDVDLTQVTSISRLQVEQLTTLIDQNSKLASELHEVRKELTEAYSMINDMRDRITELEDVLRTKSNCEVCAIRDSEV